MIKNYMTVKDGIGPKRGESLYRDLKKGGEMLYFEHNGFLFREVLEQDLPLIKEVNKMSRQSTLMLVRDKETGNYEVMSADKVYSAPTEKDILDKIRQIRADESRFALAVFEPKTKQFLALLDVEILPDSEFTEGAVEFFFSNNKITRKLFEKKVKKSFVEACKESWLFTAGCLEKVNHGDHYQLREIMA